MGRDLARETWGCRPAVEKEERELTERRSKELRRLSRELTEMWQGVFGARMAIEAGCPQLRQGCAELRQGCAEPRRARAAAAAESAESAAMLTKVPGYSRLRRD
ncbi:hypothetical protein Syun_003708 [Stephania yunnanensis]|uniref:Uncharacterized protein n=1 Tax=Stephania yunnanensis TaxID=152371 RepID=A0AAP0Q459_9MAGN